MAKGEKQYYKEVLKLLRLRKKGMETSNFLYVYFHHYHQQILQIIIHFTVIVFFKYLVNIKICQTFKASVNVVKFTQTNINFEINLTNSYNKF